MENIFVDNDKDNIGPSVRIGYRQIEEEKCLQDLIFDLEIYCFIGQLETNYPLIF